MADRAKPPVGTPQVVSPEAPLKKTSAEKKQDQQLALLSPAKRAELISSGHTIEPPWPNKKEQFDYYCGSQASVYFQEVLIDECAYVGFNRSAAKIPIYGYSGRKYCTVAQGPISVTGSFGVNFKDAGYLFVIQAYLQSRHDRATGRPGTLNATKSRDLEARAQTIENVLHVRRNPQIGLRNPGDHTGQSYINKINQLDDREFELLAEDFEKVVWGTGEGSTITAKLSDVAKKTAPDEFPAFDIFLVFGNPDDPEANFTVKRIQEVELTGSRMEYGIDGQPIIEHYSFLARDVI